MSRTITFHCDQCSRRFLHIDAAAGLQWGEVPTQWHPCAANGWRVFDFCSQACLEAFKTKLKGEPEP
jgi:hypothetical protein